MRPCLEAEAREDEVLVWQEDALRSTEPELDAEGEQTVKSDVKRHTDQSFRETNIILLSKSTQVKEPHKSLSQIYRRLGQA